MGHKRLDTPEDILKKLSEVQTEKEKIAIIKLYGKIVAREQRYNAIEEVQYIDHNDYIISTIQNAKSPV